MRRICESHGAKIIDLPVPYSEELAQAILAPIRERLEPLYKRCSYHDGVLRFETLDSFTVWCEEIEVTPLGSDVKQTRQRWHIRQSDIEPPAGVKHYTYDHLGSALNFAVNQESFQSAYDNICEEEMDAIRTQIYERLYEPFKGKVSDWELDWSY